MTIHTPTASLTGAPNWRNYVANVRADAVEITSPEVAAYMADNPGQFDTLEDALDAFRHDFCFLCPVLLHWFPVEDGELNAAGEMVHPDAPAIGYGDMAFNYGNQVRAIGGRA